MRNSQKNTKPNLYLKFSELQMLEGDDQPFCDIYGATSSSVLMEYLSPEEILNSSEEDLIAFLAEKSRNRIKDISKTADLLKKAARDSYRLDKALYEPLNVSIASSFNCIETFRRELSTIGKVMCCTGRPSQSLCKTGDRCPRTL